MPEIDDLQRMIVRHRHVAPMISTLLAATDARVRITDAHGVEILHREGPGSADGTAEREPISVEGRVVGFVEGQRPARAVAAVLSYALARELDMRSLAREALDRYRELSVIHELATALDRAGDEGAIVDLVRAEVGRIRAAGSAIVELDETLDADGAATAVAGPADPEWRDALLGAIADAGGAELVDDVAADGRASVAERETGGSLVAATLRSDGATIGLIASRSPEQGAYRAGDLKVLEAIAALVGPAIGASRRHAAELARARAQPTAAAGAASVADGTASAADPGVPPPG